MNSSDATTNGLLESIVTDAEHAVSTNLILADYLEEQGDARYELLRLQFTPPEQLSVSPERRDERVRELLAGGMVPLVPRLRNSIDMDFVLIPAGLALLGATEASNNPPRSVEITTPFWLGTYPVTQAQYQRVMGTNPSAFSSGGTYWGKVRELSTADFPVESVSWHDAQEFCARLGELEGEGGLIYHLPTEAQWEYACRGGALCQVPYHYGTTLSSRQANFDGNYPGGQGESGPYLGRTCAVGSYPPNAFGLHDLHGNVWEWCQDWYGDLSALEIPLEELKKVLRGGSWGNSGRGCRSALRYRYRPDYRDYFIGFRLAATPDPQGAPDGLFRVIRGGSWDYLGQDCRAAYRNWLRPDFRYFNLGFRTTMSLCPS